MPVTVGQRMEALKQAIEELRKELEKAVDKEGGGFSDETTHELSNKLDALIAQFLRIKEKIQGDDGKDNE